MTRPASLMVKQPSPNLSSARFDFKREPVGFAEGVGGRLANPGFWVWLARPAVDVDNAWSPARFVPPLGSNELDQRVRAGLIRLVGGGGSSGVESNDLL